MRSAAVVLVALLFGLGLSGCATVQTTDPGVVGVDRTQRMLVSSEAVEQGAAQAYAQEVARAQGAGRLNQNEAAVARVRRIARAVIDASAAFRDDARSWDWQINVLEADDQVNAYAMPGGRIMVYSGLLEKLQPTDAELATVIAHEVAHALREHTRERVSRLYAQQLVLAGAAAVTGASPTAQELAGLVANVTLTLPFSREQESEADLVGLELQARAGFDPAAAITLWQKMEQLPGSGGPEFLSTHPSGSSRIEEISAMVPKLRPIYEQTVAARGR